MKRRRSVAVTLGLTPLLASAILTACSSEPEPEVDEAAVCVDKATEQRVDDSECNDGARSGGGGGSGLFLWYFLRTGGYFPPVGQRVSGGSFTPGTGTSVRGGVPKDGGVVARGGFGSRGSGGSGG